MSRPKTDLLQGTLDMLILKTLALGRLHGSHGGLSDIVVYGHPCRKWPQVGSSGVHDGPVVVGIGTHRDFTTPSAIV